MGQHRGRATKPDHDNPEGLWTQADLALLAELRDAEALLPADAPRGLLSVRLSVMTHDTTSPARQELDLRVLARERGIRVVGVASDLNVSATKVPPWKRKQLGDWLHNRAPEFDVLLFWKLDRFVRRLSDLSTMIDWCSRYGKNLASKHDPVDLTSEAGKILTTVIGGVAQIEAANTSTRVTGLWDYTKSQSEWLVGKPTYGYTTAQDERGRPVLVHDEAAVRVLRWCRAMALRGVSARHMVKVIDRTGLCGPGLTTSTLLRRLRNPGLTGYRVQEDRNGGVRRARLVLGRNGQPTRVADPIFTRSEFDELQAALDKRSKNQPLRQPGGATRFLGVLVCAECGTTLTAQRTSNKGRAYEYLRCRGCPGGGMGAPDPQGVYSRLAEEVLAVLGDIPVRIRVYVSGREGEAAADRWENVLDGRSLRTYWQSAGAAVMAADLLRAGITCRVTRVRIPKVRAPGVRLQLVVPKDARDRLVIKPDAFGSGSDAGLSQDPVVPCPSRSDTAQAAT
ncbi:recombinase family protein [Streptacidiphilus sp. N1-12]|uniref:Recombinase family protein n=2 Tax=Streptacidiphilus alkalitolerans TaxID=3342712 RepID=A0ABV6WJU0_9ACTN